MSRKPRHGTKPRVTAWGLASFAMIMILAAVGAVFLPADGKTTAGLPLYPLIHPPASSSSPQPSPSPAHPPSPAPTQPASYPAPARTYPAPSRTYPAPAARTYPAPVRTYPAPATTYPAPPPSPTPPPGSDLPAVVPLIPPIQGVVSPDVPAWNAMTGTTAELAVSYVSMAASLAPTFLHSAMRVAAGATPVIEMTPGAFGQTPLTLEQIASGQADTWLTAMRQQIDMLARPVVLSFAPEPNGTWYSWHTDPSGFKAAWQHVHQVIGTADVTWAWQPSAVGPGGAHNPVTGKLITDDMAPYWPGAGEVDWVALDGYYYRSSDTFRSRFSGALAELAQPPISWTGPVIIGETAVSPFTGPGGTAPDPAKITDLFAGVAANHLLGLVYFDLKPACPPQCQQDGIPRDFRLEKYPDALAAYVKAVHGSW